MGTTIQAAAVGGLLLVGAVEDIKTRRLHLVYLIFFGVVAVLMHAFLKDLSWWSMLGGSFLGGLLILASIWSRGKIGLGDGAMIMVTGAFLGLEENLLLLMASAFLAGIYALVLLVKRRVSQQQEIAFMPFLFVGYLILELGKRL